MVRKFSLINKNNATYDFTNPAMKVFAANPAGLGFVVDSSTLRLGNELIITEQQYEFVPKTFDIIFYGDTRAKMYGDYNKFVKFLSVGGIYLVYEVPSMATSYRIKVLVTELTKTEVKDNGYMTCELSLMPLSFWEDSVKNVIEVNNATEESKHYELDRPYFYGTSGTDAISLNVLGTIESPLEITIDGNVSDPQYNLYNGEGELIGAGKFEGEYDYVYVNSAEAEEQIILSSNGVALEYPYNYQDLSIGVADQTKVTFMKLGIGLNTLSFVLGSTFEGTVKIEWRNKYVSV